MIITYRASNWYIMIFRLHKTRVSIEDRVYEVRLLAKKMKPRIKKINQLLLCLREADLQPKKILLRLFKIMTQNK